MNNVTRRSFLQKVTGGLLAFIPASLALAEINKSSALGMSEAKITDMPQTIIFENYAEGIAKKVNVDSIVVTTTRIGDVKLRLEAKSRIWKGDYLRTRPIEVGDEVIAWGQPYENGKIINVEKIWVNIINVRGSISDIVPTTKGVDLFLNDTRTGKYLIQFDEQTSIMLPGGREETFKGSNLQLKDGQRMQVIGLKLKGGGIQAGRVWIGQ